MSGYIKLHRGWQDSDLFPNEPYCARAAWCWLISNAAWKETIRHGGKGDEVVLQPGQIHVSDRSLASVWGWDKKRVRRFLAKLERSKTATSKRTANGTVLTIENWDKYQSSGPTGGPSTGPTEDQPRTTQEEGKERKEEKNTHYAFFGRVIRLNGNDLERWRKRYNRIEDIEAELGSMDDWLSGQPEDRRKNWFHIASGALNKKHQAAGKNATSDPMEGFIA